MIVGQILLLLLTFEENRMSPNDYIFPLVFNFSYIFISYVYLHLLLPGLNLRDYSLLLGYMFIKLTVFFITSNFG
jgi:hypothetical protein